MCESSARSSLLTALKHGADEFVRLLAVLAVVPLCISRTVPARHLASMICLCFAATATAAAGRSAERTWSDKQGNQVEGRYIRIRNDVVVVQASNKIHRIPLGNLSIADQEYVHFRQLGLKQRNQAMHDILSRDERTWQTSSGGK